MVAYEMNRFKQMFVIPLFNSKAAPIPHPELLRVKFSLGVKLWPSVRFAGAMLSPPSI